MQQRGFWRYENGLLAMMCMTFGFVFFDRMAIVFMFPYIVKDIALTNTQMGMLTSMLSLMWAVSGYMIGAYADRRGNRKAILVAMVTVFSICSFLSGMATSFLFLLLFRGVMGLAEGPVLPIAQSMMAEESSPARRGFNMGLLQNGAGSLMSLLLGPIIVVALAQAFTWRVAFFISGIPGLIIAALLWRFVRKNQAGQVGLEAPAMARPKSAMTFGQLLAYRNIVLCVLISCAFLTWFIVLVTFAPIYLVKQRGLSPESMSTVMAALGMAAVIWGFVAPALSDRFGRRPIVVFFCLVSILAPLSIIYVHGSAMVMACAIFFTYAGAGCLPLVMATIPSETIPSRYVATALGLIMGAGEVIGGVISPVLAGMAADRFGAEAPFWMSAGGAALATALALCLVETAPAALERRQRMASAIPDLRSGLSEDA
jgi:MFS family permease